MKCPRCQSTEIRKNGRPKGQQRYLCKACGKQFSSSSFSPLPSTAEPDAVPFTNNGYSEAALEETALPLEETEIPTPSERGIAILLLDAENLKLDISIERFLASICTHPLQVKIAFANWRNPTVGKLDAELYERAYQLIHVPGGKDSADAKMIGVGSSIFLQYPNVKEVLVYSCDGIFIHLCNELQNKGLTVYRLRVQNKTLQIENCQTGDFHYYSLAIEREIPSFDGLAKQVEALLDAERESIAERIGELSILAGLFQERCNLTFTNRDRSGDSLNSLLETDSSASLPDTETILAFSATSIQSLENFEKALVALINKLKAKSGKSFISVDNLKDEFQIQYQESADIMVKKLQPKSTLIKFLRSRSTVFKLTLIGNDYQVAIAPS